MSVQPALSPDNWDLMLTDDGDLALVSDGAEVAQHIRQRLNFFQAEWAWDLTAGLPWFGEILGSRRFRTQQENRSFAESILKTEILETPGVTRLLVFQFTFDELSRNATFEFHADTLFGDVGTNFFEMSIIS